MIAPNHDPQSPALRTPDAERFAPGPQRELWVEHPELGFERHVLAGPLRLLPDGQLVAHVPARVGAPVPSHAQETSRLPSDEASEASELAESDAEPKTPAVILHPALPPVGEAGATAAVLFVPDVVMQDGSLDVRVRGLRVGPGLHVLQHADSIEFGAARVWLSAEGRGERGVYDPARDGADAFCARTKMRLTEGDSIVRCPGSATRPCSLVFKISAWDPTLVCHGCGHDPATPPWTPPGVAPARTRSVMPGAMARTRDSGPAGSGSSAGTSASTSASASASAGHAAGAGAGAGAGAITPSVFELDREAAPDAEHGAQRPAAVPLSSVAHLTTGSSGALDSASDSAPDSAPVSATSSARADHVQASPGRSGLLGRSAAPGRSSVRTVDALLDLTSRARAARTPAALPEPESPR